MLSRAASALIQLRFRLHSIDRMGSVTLGCATAAGVMALPWLIQSGRLSSLASHVRPAALTSPCVSAAWLLVALAVGAPWVAARSRKVRWHPWLMLAGAALAAWMGWTAWRVAGRAALPTHSAWLSASVAAVLAFGTLIAERACAAHVDGTPERIITLWLRLPLATLVVAGATDGFCAVSSFAPAWPMRGVAAFVFVLACEMAVRASLIWFSSPHVGFGACPVDSALVRILHWDRATVATLNDTWRKHIGLDLRQNWALHTVWRLLPLACMLFALAGWLSSGVVVLRPDERGVYERLGRPSAVWQPGLHMGLPWPLGLVRRVENGTIHETVVSGGEVPHGRIDEVGEASPDRLWDVVHAGETTQVIAGAAGQSQDFQLVSADIRLNYRIGLSDEAARDALFRTVDPMATLQVLAGREVVLFLASRTLEALLDERQTTAREALRDAIQHRLDAAHSGIELTAVVIEAIHPPAAAAAAWHAVQAAQIEAQTLVARAHGSAAEQVGAAREQAASMISGAAAVAVDTRAQAQVQATGFAADVAASRTDGAAGAAFRFEYRMHRLMRGLANAHFTVLDARLAGERSAVVDLRDERTSGEAGSRAGY